MEFSGIKNEICYFYSSQPVTFSSPIACLSFRRAYETPYETNIQVGNIQQKTREFVQQAVQADN